MAHFEKVRTGHERWRTQLPASSAVCLSAGRWYDIGKGQSHASLGRET